jgi:hypothetical protein
MPSDVSFDHGVSSAATLRLDGSTVKGSSEATRARQILDAERAHRPLHPAAQEPPWPPRANVRARDAASPPDHARLLRTERRRVSARRPRPPTPAWRPRRVRAPPGSARGPLAAAVRRSTACPATARCSRARRSPTGVSETSNTTWSSGTVSICANTWSRNAAGDRSNAKPPSTGPLRVTSRSPIGTSSGKRCRKCVSMPASIWRFFTVGSPRRLQSVPPAEGAARVSRGDGPRGVAAARLTVPT